MTTFQDPQPQSRRAVRQGERGEAADNTFTQFPPAEPASAREMWDTTARRAAQLPPVAPRADAPAAASGRRAAPATNEPAAVAEPLTYATQSRPAVPSYDGPTFRSRAAAPARDDDAQPATQALPQADQPGYRVRDFSPEGRRSTRAAETTEPAAWAPPAAPADLEYHTEARVTPVFHPQPVVEAVPAAVAPPVEHTLSRRELRAMQQAEQDASIQAHTAASEPVALVEPTAFDALFRAPSDHAHASAQQLHSQQPAAPAFLQPAPSLPPVAPEPIATPALANAFAEFDFLTSSQQPVSVPPVSSQPVSSQPDSSQPGAVPQVAAPQTSFSPPTGHWASQLDHNDDDVFETTINRTIGSGHTATNALVLPTVPEGNDIRGPLTRTGEIMLTGSIDLPRTLSATGTSDRFDHDGIDALFDVNDHELISTDSSPVRAIRAVSTHTSGHGVTHTQKPKGTRALTVLLIAASSMAVVVAALLVAAFVFNVF